MNIAHDGHNHYERVALPGGRKALARAETITEAAARVLNSITVVIDSDDGSEDASCDDWMVAGSKKRRKKQIVPRQPAATSRSMRSQMKMPPPKPRPPKPHGVLPAQ